MTLKLNMLDQPVDESMLEVVTQPSNFENSLITSSLSADFRRAISLTQLVQVFDNLVGKVKVADQVIEQICTFFNASAAFIAEYYPEQGQLVITTEHGIKEGSTGSALPGTDNVVYTEAFAADKYLFQADITTEARFEQLNALPLVPVHGFLAVPLKWRGERVGVLGVYPESGWGTDGILSANEQQLVYSAATLVSQLVFNARVLKENETARNDFTDMLVYGLKGPMASIMGAIDLLHDAQGPDAQSAQLLTIARRNGARMLTMIETLLDLNKLEHGDLYLDLERLQLKQLVEITVQAMDDQFRAKNLEVQVKLPAEQVLLRVDLNRMLKVLIHLLENALNFTEQGTIEIWAEHSQGKDGEPEVLVVISDTGSGIATAQLKELFDRFSRARQYRQLDLASGGGLGLNYAKLVISAHSGKIWAESPGRLGKGTSFYLTLPLYQG